MTKTQQFLKNKPKAFFIAFLLMLIASFFIPENAATEKIERAEIENSLAATQKLMNNILKEAARTEDAMEMAGLSNQYSFAEKGISVFVFKGSELFLWSDNEVKIDSSIFNRKNNELLQLNNGFYVKEQLDSNGSHFIALLSIKKQFSIQNNYLPGTFNDGLKIPDDVQFITHDFQKGDSIINATNDKPLFALRIIQKNSENSFFGLAAWLVTLAFFLLLAAFYFLISHLQRWQQWVLFFSPFILRAIMIHFQLPHSLYGTAFFSPLYYASNVWFGSLGDLLLNVVTLFWMMLTLRSMMKDYYVPVLKSKSIFTQIGIYLFLTILLKPVVDFCKTIVSDSKINFDVNKVLDTNSYTLIGLIIVILTVLSWIIFSAIILSKTQPGKTKNLWSLILSVTIIFIFTWNSLLSVEHFIYATFATILFILLFDGEKLFEVQLNRMMLIVVLSSLFSAWFFHEAIEKKEFEWRKILCTKLLVRQDKVAEYLFEDIVQKINADEEVKRLFSTSKNPQPVLSQLLQKKYLSDYFSRYNVNLICLDASLKPMDKSVSVEEAENLIALGRESGDNTLSSNLVSIENENGRLTYLAGMNLHDNEGKNLGALLMTLEAKPSLGLRGYPQLLISSKVSSAIDLSAYNYATYYKQKITEHQGDDGFPAKLFPIGRGEYVVIEEGDREWLIYQTASDRSAILSKSYQPWKDYFSLSSYIFVLCIAVMFALMLLQKLSHRLKYFSTREIVLLILAFVVPLITKNAIITIIAAIYFLRKRKTREGISLKSRIQLSAFAITFITVSLLGLVSIKFMQQKNESKQAEELNASAHQLLANLDNLYNTTNSDQRGSLLPEMAASLGIDFNLFDDKGKLIFTSQPKLIEQGIVAPLLHPNAMAAIQNNNKIRFTQQEKTGSLSYISTYELLNTSDAKSIVVQVPYFEQEESLKKEISGYLSNFINLYVLLFALTLMLAYFISSRISQPLQIIGSRISSFRLGQKNQHIEWKGNDEIGKLVKQYNLMIDEVEKSAGKLAQSERESAWREMAKQVAHEIKNPLTPMKLSLQHLQMAIAQNSSNVPELTEKVTRTVIEQIDSLADIATAFSSFAKMPDSKPENVELQTLLQNNVQLFREEKNEVKIIFNDEIQKPVFIHADKNKLNRVFVNLMRNAFQALEENKHGLIEITLKENQRQYLIIFRDNGKGIPIDSQPNIFTPSFTTKTSGSGLGLAMSKNIIEELNGTISFTSSENVFTEFVITLPSS